ncbi:MAG: class I SAM-dependent methyltransferase [Patescibacteria group bacterium]
MSYDSQELFKDTAKGYASFRTGYPKEFFDHVIKYFGLNGKGRLLDLGCGTGQVAIPLAPHFEEVVGVDPAEGMLAEAEKIAEKSGIKNIKWILKKAEDISSELGQFRLASFGASFHWMEQDKVLVKLYPMIEPGGGLVMVSGSSSIWRNPENEPWKAKCKEVLIKFLGEKRRAGNSYYTEPKERFEDILLRSKFSKFEKWIHDTRRRKAIDDIIGLLYTTSFAQKRFFGDRLEDFEKELRRELLKFSPSGEFTEKVQTEALLVCK